jgi:GNAT superfamily N-acetyltransferase
MVAFQRAKRADAEVLTEVQKRTFDDDSRRFRGQPSGGPPGYDSVFWSRKIMGIADYYKIVSNRTIIGGIIVFNKGGGHYELGRIFIDPEHQNQGIGTQALRWLEAKYPLAKKWTLDTPSWATRNHHFYEKLGFVVVWRDGETVLYEKVMDKKPNPLVHPRA